MSTERRTLNIGVISLGWMGRLHARSYLAVAQYFTELPVRVVLHTAADPDEGGRNYAYEALGFKNAVSDYKELLANPELAEFLAP